MPRRSKKTSIFKVAVVGVVSSGKTTLLNAMIGWHLLPSAVTACTDRIISIEDCDNLPAFFAKRNKKNTTTCIQKNSSCFKAGQRSSSSSVEIVGDVLGVENVNGCRIVFLDTPGVNNARDRMHGLITSGFVSKGEFDLLLFVLDATELNTVDEQRAMMLIPREKRNDVVFVLNKIDRLDIGRGETPSSVVVALRHHLSSQGFSESVPIIPAIAELSLLVRSFVLLGKSFDNFDDQFVVLNMIRKARHHQEELKTGLLSGGIQRVAPSRVLRNKFRHRTQIEIAGESIPKDIVIACEALSGVPSLESLIEHAVLRRFRQIYL